MIERAGRQAEAGRLLTSTTGSDAPVLNAGGCCYGFQAHRHSLPFAQTLRLVVLHSSLCREGGERRELSALNWYGAVSDE